MTGTIKDLLMKGLHVHRSGDTVKAEALYRKVLSRDPGQPDALYLLGMIALQHGDNERAAERIAKALERNRTMPEYHANLAIALQNLGKNEDAVLHCREALALRPGQFAVLNTLGNALMALEKREEAVACFLRAIELSPASMEIHFNLANALRVMERSDEAVQRYREVLRLQPGHVEARYRLGALQQKLQQAADARGSYRAVLALQPGHADALCGLADVLHKLEEYEESEDCYRRALSLRPDSAPAWNGLGNTLRLLGRMEEALVCYRRALELQPGSLEFYCNISNVLFDLGRLDEAVESCEAALSLHPDFTEAHWNMGPALLAKGDFVRGWRQYDYRLALKDALKTTFTCPDWDGAPLPGGALLIYAEQGVGDEIMFASCIPDAMRSAACIIECDARLVPLFGRSFPAAALIVRGKGAALYPADLPAPDAKIALGSLPRIFRSRLEDFPGGRRYLIADRAAAARWRERYDSLGGRLRVGISWRGGKIAVVRRTRSTVLEQWKDVLSIPDISFVNLQYGDCRRELSELKAATGITIHDWDDSDPLKNLDDFAAKIAALDLVLSVDNSTVHLAGALGVPVWTLLTYGCDWRWMREREDTPWYPSMRLFRQPAAGEWDVLFKRVAERLAAVRDPGVLEHDSCSTTGGRV